MTMTKRVVTLAHYYTQPEIQKMADKVGDSLELSLNRQDTESASPGYSAGRGVNLFSGDADRCYRTEKMA